MGDTLIEVLEHQLMEYDLSDIDLAIAQYIIGNLDDNGYLTRDLYAINNDLAFSVGIDVSMADLKRVSNVVRSLDPAGIGAIVFKEPLLTLDHESLWHEWKIAPDQPQYVVIVIAVDVLLQAFVDRFLNRVFEVED